MADEKGGLPRVDRRCMLQNFPTHWGGEKGVTRSSKKKKIRSSLAEIEVVRKRQGVRKKMKVHFRAPGQDACTVKGGNGVRYA